MKLGPVLRKYRLHAEKSLRELAAEIGVSSSTLSRVERGEEMDGETLAKIINWLTGKGEVVA